MADDDLPLPDADDSTLKEAVSHAAKQKTKPEKVLGKPETSAAKANGFPNASVDKSEVDDKTPGTTSGSGNASKWGDKLRVTREKQMENMRKKADGLKESEIKAEECRKKADDERKKRMDDLRRREEQHRVEVEERRKKMVVDENERRLALMKKTMERDLKLDHQKSKVNGDVKLLNGTKSPKQPQQQQQSSPQQQQQQVKRPHSVAGRPPSYASPTVASTTRMARSSEKDGEVITVCFRCRSAPPDFRSKFLEQQQQTSNGQNRSSHPVFSVTVPVMEFFSARSSVSNGKDMKQVNGKPAIIIRPSETLSSKPPLPTISATSTNIQQKPKVKKKRPISAILEPTKENAAAMLEVRNLKNLQMQKQAGPSASPPSSIDSKKRIKNQFALDLNKDYLGDLSDNVKPKRKETTQVKKRSISALPDRKKTLDHDTGKSVFVAETTIGFAATTPFPTAKVPTAPAAKVSTATKQPSKVQKDITNRLESKSRKLPASPSVDSKKKSETHEKPHKAITDQLKDRMSPLTKPSFLAPKTKQTSPVPPAFEIKKPIPRPAKTLELDGGKKVEEVKETKENKVSKEIKTPVKDVIKENHIESKKVVDKAKDKMPKLPPHRKEGKAAPEAVPKSHDVETKTKSVTKEKITPKTEKEEIVGKREKIEKEIMKERVDEVVVKPVENGVQQDQQVEEKEAEKSDSNVEQQKVESKIIEKERRSQKEKERSEKLKKDEEERINRKKRVDLIMKRVKPDDSSRSSSIEKEPPKLGEDTEKSKNEDAAINVTTDGKSRGETAMGKHDPQIKSENDELSIPGQAQEETAGETTTGVTEAGVAETQETNLAAEEEEFSEETENSKPGKSSFFDKLTLKLKKALSPSDKKGFPKNEPLNVQDLSGLLIQAAIEKHKVDPEDYASASTTEEEVVHSETTPERRESTTFGLFGRMSGRKQSKDISAEEKADNSSKEPSPPANGAHAPEKRKSITEAAFSMFGIRSKRLSKDLEVTPEEKPVIDAEKVPTVEERETLADDNMEKKASPEAAFNLFGMIAAKRKNSKDLEQDQEGKVVEVTKEGETKDIEMSVIKGKSNEKVEEEERVSSIVSEFVPGIEDGGEVENEGEQVDGMDDECRQKMTSRSSISEDVVKSPIQLPSQPDEKSQALPTKDDEKKKFDDDSKDEIDKKSSATAPTATGDGIGKDLTDNKAVKDEKVKQEPTTDATKSQTEIEVKTVAGTESSKEKSSDDGKPKQDTNNIKAPDMIKVTSPDMINIVVQKRDEDASTNLSNLDSNPSGSTSSLDIVKSEDSSSGDILMSDESPTEVKGQQGGDKERAEERDEKSKKLFDVSSDKTHGKGQKEAQMSKSDAMPSS